MKEFYETWDKQAKPEHQESMNSEALTWEWQETMSKLRLPKIDKS